MSQGLQPSPALGRRETWWIFGLALALRLLVALWGAGRFPPADDGSFYHVVATRIAHGDGYTWAWPDGVITYAAHYPVGYPALLGAGYTLMGELKLISEIWTNRPSPAGLKLFGSEYRRDHVSAWTGTEMLVWGGIELTNGKPSYVRLNTGWRYRPSTETWLPMSTNNAPSGRNNAQAVWTGTELIVWSGDAGTRDLVSGDRSMATNGAQARKRNDAAIRPPHVTRR